MIGKRARFCLNSRVPPFSDYVARTNKRRRRRRKPIRWLFVLGVLCLAVCAWWFWSKLPPPPSPAPLPRPLPVITQAPPIIVSKPPVKSVTAVTNVPPTTAPKITTPVAAPPVVVTSPPPPRVIFRTNAAPNATGFPRPPQDVLETQIALARHAISPGSLDGVMGSQTRAALVTFQRREGLPETGALDAPTRAALALTTPPLTTYLITPNDLARLQPINTTWLGKSQQTALDYETIVELVAELGHASPTLVRRLNPEVDWTNITTGTEVRVPDPAYPPLTQKAGFAVITLGAKQLQVFDSQTNLLAHFPCSIAARVEKRPAGELHIVAIAENPNYTFNPEVFPESVEARALGRKLILPPGPNNPVGVAWVSLDKPGYGIHGTPSPEQVGRTESHGCFRLANWNAAYFLKLAWIGMPVYVEP